MANAVLGYLRMDVVNPLEGAVWGRFNNRPPVDSHVKALAESFVSHIDNCLSTYTMDIALDPRWLRDKNSPIERIDGTKIADIPELEIALDADHIVKKGNLWVLSGNHRRLALIRYTGALKKEIEDISNQIQKAEGKSKSGEDASNNTISVEDARFVESSKARIDKLRAKIKASSYWTVRVYDRGERRVFLRRFATRKATPMTMLGPVLSEDRAREQKPTGDGEGRLSSHLQKRDEDREKHHGRRVPHGGHRGAQGRARGGSPQVVQNRVERGRQDQVPSLRGEDEEQGR
jgi:hypothetical protein